MDDCSGFTKAHEDVKNSNSNLVIIDGFAMFDTNGIQQEFDTPKQIEATLNYQYCETTWDSDDFTKGVSQNATKT